MTIPQITVLSKVQVDFWNSYIQVYDLKLEDMVLENEIIFGFDPGSVNLGLSFITSKIFRALEIKTKRRSTTEQRIIYIWNLLGSLNILPTNFIIEGASYADRYRQIELQDIRAGAVSWVLKNDSLFWKSSLAKIIPPLTIRKVVFGSAKIKNPWTEQGIPDNAAAALGCALYPIMKGRTK